MPACNVGNLMALNAEHMVASLPDFAAGIERSRRAVRALELAVFTLFLFFFFSPQPVLGLRCLPAVLGFTHLKINRFPNSRDKNIDILISTKMRCLFNLRRHDDMDEEDTSLMRERKVNEFL